MTMTNLHFTTELRQQLSQGERLISRVFAVLLRKWQANERRWVVVSHSQIADELGCSAGNLPEIMRRLEQAGLIAREIWRNKWRRIRVLRLPEVPSAQAALIDQSGFEQLMLPMELPPEAPVAHQDAVEAQVEASEEPIDRSALHIRKNSFLSKEEEGAPARALSQPSRVAQPQTQQLDQEIYAWLMQDPRMYEPTARQIAARPIGTLRDLTNDYEQAEKMQARGEIHAPRWFLVKRWATGQRVPATPDQEEQHGTRPTIQQRPTPNVRRGTAAPADRTPDRGAPASSTARPTGGAAPANFQRTTFRAPSTNW